MKMNKPKHDFYLNAYEFYKWSRCLTCDSKMKVRKFCLMIHYQENLGAPPRMLSFNKSCKYCEKCDMIVVQKSEIEEHLKPIIAQLKMRFFPEKYFIFGTISKKKWLTNQKFPKSPKEMMSSIHPFKEVHQFAIQPAGWYKDDE